VEVSTGKETCAGMEACIGKEAHTRKGNCTNKGVHMVEGKRGSENGFEGGKFQCILGGDAHKEEGVHGQGAVE
jgi:hypothetical protein